MSVKVCSKCGLRVDGRSAFCPKCGSPLGTTGPIPPPVGAFAVADSSTGRRLPVWLIVVVVLVACGIVGQFLPSSPEDLSVDACLYSREFVKRSLKAPSTASFPGGCLDRPETSVVPMGDGVYVVHDEVDAENSFGAMLRSKTLAAIRRDGDGWVNLGVVVGDDDRARMALLEKVGS